MWHKVLQFEHEVHKEMTRITAESNENMKELNKQEQELRLKVRLYSNTKTKYS